MIDTLLLPTLQKLTSKRPHLRATRKIEKQTSDAITLERSNYPIHDRSL